MIDQQGPWLLDEHSPTKDVLLVGGKGKRLLDLAQSGYRVPSFFIIPANVCRECLKDDSELEPLLTRISKMDTESTDFREYATTIRSRIAEKQLPPELTSAIEVAVDTLPPGHVAVRSSAIDEDAADLSFAGLHDSFLFQQEVHQVATCVTKVWASAYNERALSYRIRHAGQSKIHLVPMAVVVQRMVNARTSGVAFTCHPSTYDVTLTVVSSLWGAGEGLVSEGLDADTFVVNKHSGEVESDVADKVERLVFGSKAGSGLQRETTPLDMASIPSLNSKEVAQVAKLASDIEQRYRTPQDIEFCFDEAGELYLLQARPVAGVPEYGPAAGHPLLWDNSNIIESYSGVTSPMTFSFIRRAYTIVYHCFSEVMGIPVSVVKQNRHTFENMLGLIRGRVYYNLKNWYRLIRLFPGYEYNSRAMESMMGVKESFALEDDSPQASFWTKWFVEFPKLLRLVFRTAWNFIRLRKKADEFQARFQAHYQRWDQMELEALTPHQLMNLYHEMEDALLWNWKAPIINDFYVMIYFGLLRKLSKSWCGDDTDSLQNDLVCGEPGIESAEPAKFLLRLAQQATHHKFLRNAIINDDPEILLQEVAERADCQEFHEQMQQYLELYGFRCMNELKLEEYSLRDRPQVVYQLLRNYLVLDDPAALDVEGMGVREQKIRNSAEQRVARAMTGKPVRRWLFQRVLNRARMGVKNRENMRFARTRIYGVVRELLRAMGTQLAEEKVLSDREDIFYLTIDEVWDYVKGTAVSVRLAELAALRRAEFKAYRTLDDPPDERFTTYGMVYHRNLFRETEQEHVEEDGELRGIGVCAGEVIAETKIILSPSDNVQLAKEILVAERTDPGWVPLYPAVSGILIERGSVLSHSAVVAREMGIPTIVGIRGLLHRVNSGDVVKMDGRSGLVEIVNSCEQASSEVKAPEETGNNGQPHLET